MLHVHGGQERKNTLRDRELATSDENRRAVGMLNPMRDENEGTYRRGELW